MAYTAEDVERMKANVLKPDDTFTFTCQMCGNCCRNRAEPILLTGPDIFRIVEVSWHQTWRGSQQISDRVSRINIKYSCVCPERTYGRELQPAAKW